MSLIRFTVLLFVLVWALPAQAKHLFYEYQYQNKWCPAGKTEIVLNDGADCELDNYIIEFDFAYKYREAIAQSLEYAVRTGKNPGIVLIIEKPSDMKYLHRLKLVAAKYKIKVWTITPDELQRGG